MVKFTPATKSAKKKQKIVPKDKTYGIGKIIKQARESRQMTQDELGLRVGLSRASIANMEGGKQTLMLEVAMNIFRALQYNFEISISPKEK